MKKPNQPKREGLKSLYSIEGLTTRGDQGMGGYGVRIILDRAVVSKIYKHPVRRNEQSPLYQMLVREIDNKYGYIKFIEDSWLLRIIQLEPTSCSCFGLDGMGLERVVAGEDDAKWTSHNIDHPMQAAKLVAIWLRWFNHMAALEDGDGTIVTFPFCC